MIDFARRILRALVFRCRSAMWTVSSWWRSTVTVSTKQGKYTLRLGREEFIGKCLYCTGEFELEMITQAMALLRSEGLDVPASMVVSGASISRQGRGEGIRGGRTEEGVRGVQPTDPPTHVPAYPDARHAPPSKSRYSL